MSYKINPRRLELKAIILQGSKDWVKNILSIYNYIYAKEYIKYGIYSNVKGLIFNIIAAFK